MIPTKKALYNKIKKWVPTTISKLFYHPMQWISIHLHLKILKQNLKIKTFHMKMMKISQMIIANLNHLSHQNKINMNLKFKKKSSNNIWSSPHMIIRLNNSNCSINHQLLLANHPKLSPNNSLQNLTAKSTCKKLPTKFLLCKTNNS